MKKILFPLTLSIVFFAACNNEQGGGMTDNEIQAKADSVVGTKIEQLNQEAMDDLDKRMPIEVKQKADSIVAAAKK